MFAQFISIRQIDFDAKKYENLLIRTIWDFILIQLVTQSLEDKRVT